MKRWICGLGLVVVISVVLMRFGWRSCDLKVSRLCLCILGVLLVRRWVILLVCMMLSCFIDLRVKSVLIFVWGVGLVRSFWSSGIVLGLVCLVRSW